MNAKIQIPDASCTTVNCINLSVLLEEQTDVKVLSLDCFDTLLWRSVAKPTDVFLSIQSHDLYTSNNLNARIRERAESACRKRKMIIGGSSEVKIGDIYRYALPQANANLIEQLVELELREEEHACFIFRPALDLLAKAKAQGLKTMIVSDTYLSASQLKHLLDTAIQAAGQPNPIDEIFTSSDFNCSKSNGLLGKVSAKLGINPNKIVHIGDNKGADFEGARRSGVRGIHLKRHSDTVETVERMTFMVSKLLDPDTVQKAPTPALHHHTWATLTDPVSPEQLVAWCALGPVMVNYVRWVNDQAKILINEGARPRLVFLMRDGFLPYEIFKVIAQGDTDLSYVPAATVDVSRFVATACSFFGKENVQDYLRSGVSANNTRAALKQLLFTDVEIEQTAVRYGHSDADWNTFCEDMTTSTSLRKIVPRSEIFRNRFLRYFESQVNPKKGETLLFIDLGYAGTIQNLLAPLLEKIFEVHVKGKYLLVQDIAHPPRNIEGFISSKHIDTLAIDTLLSQIKTLEQLCCNSNSSTVGYRDDCTPIYKSSNITQEQKDIRALIQRNALNFAEQAHIDAVLSRPGDIAARRATLASLGRLLLLPTEKEVQLLAGFAHDVNLGTSMIEKMVDTQRSQTDLWRRGLLYLNGVDRSAPAHELVTAGTIDLPLFNLTANRFGLDVRSLDFQKSEEKIRVLISDGQNFFHHDVATYRTFDGFRLLLLPLPAATAGVGLLLGQICRWIQVESASLCDFDTAFNNSQSMRNSVHLTDQLKVESCTSHGSQLFEFKEQSGLIFCPLKDNPLRSKARKQVYAFVYRPLVNWQI